MSWLCPTCIHGTPVEPHKKGCKNKRYRCTKEKWFPEYGRCICENYESSEPSSVSDRDLI